MEQVDVAVLGAGAAGLYAAIETARRGRRTVVLDHARAPGEKIRISGGGRCNFTNLAAGDRSAAQSRFLSENPRFALSALARHRPEAFIARLDRAGIAWHEKTAGQLFCDGSARQVVDLLTGDLRAAGGELRLGVRLCGVRREGAGFVVETEAGPLGAQAVIVATGGRSIPKMGATGIGYRIAESFGLRVTPTRPALVPFTLPEAVLARSARLAGLAVPVRLACAGAGFEAPLLFTHRGLSGPAVLQVSSYWREGAEVIVDFLPGADPAALLRAARAEHPRQSPATILARHLPARLADHLAEDPDAGAAPAPRIGALSNGQIERLAAQIRAHPLRPQGTEGYRTAEVTLGGVDTAALDARTLAARTVPGLHFVGEVVDVTGWLGGYNFQWAWASGHAAGQVA